MFDPFTDIARRSRVQSFSFPFSIFFPFLWGCTAGTAGDLGLNIRQAGGSSGFKAAKVETADWTDQTLPSWRHSVWVRDSGFTPFTLVKTLVATVNQPSVNWNSLGCKGCRLVSNYPGNAKKLEAVNLTVKRCQKLGTLLTSLAEHCHMRITEVGVWSPWYWIKVTLRLGPWAAQGNFLSLRDASGCQETSGISRFPPRGSIGV